MTINNLKVQFKNHSSKQMMLLPPSLEDLIEDKNHPVFIVNKVIDRIDIEPLIKTYKGGGTTSYHPRMLLKIIIFSYLNNVYTTRGIEDQLKSNIHYMWLSGMSRPDHNTIFRFRSKRLKGEIKKIFAMVVALLVEEGLISIKEAFIDGTKIEANANRYTFVWGNAIKTNKEKIKEQLKELWAYVEKVCKEEKEQLVKPDFTELSPEKLEATIDTINKALAEKKVDKKIKQKIRYAAKNWGPKLKEYQAKEQVLKNRNSYSKIDPDATFMRMKEDHMLNGQLKPAYNFMISTNQQFCTCYTIGQSTTDTSMFIKHYEEFNQLHNAYPKEITGDAGFGSEENYEFLEDKGISPFVKFNYFHKEQTKKWKKEWFRLENLYYNQKQDCFYCPMGQKMKKIGESEKRTKTGFVQHILHYQAINCNSCPLRGQCHK
ncbi:MAG: IS1182 family transposase, partial [Thiohalospira sp.]